MFREKILTIFWPVIFLVFCLPLTVCAEGSIPFKEGDVLTLTQCVEIALKNQPTLKAARSSVEAGQARVTQSKADYLPQISLNSAYDRVHTEFSGRWMSAGGTTSNYSSGVNLTQLFYDFGRTGGKIEASRQNLTMSEYEALDVIQAVILNVEQAYYNLLKSQRLLSVAEETIRQREEHLKQAQAFYRVGTRAKIDVTKAEVDLANSRLDKIKAENTLKVAKASLNNAMGVRTSVAYTVENNLQFVPFREELTTLTGEALKSRPDTLALDAQYNSQKATLESALGEYYPSLSGNASYNLEGDEYPKDKNWNLGATITFPIFSGFATKGKVAEARAQLQKIQAEKEALEQNVCLEVEQAFWATKEAEELIQTTEKNVIQARENLDLAEGRYKAGLGSAIEFMDAQILYTKANVDHIQALYSHKTAVATLLKAVGRLTVSGQQSAISVQPLKTTN
ncbi:MAG: TolC family protein [Thermodesulfobacteriota bacterium]